MYFFPQELLYSLVEQDSIPESLISGDRGSARLAPDPWQRWLSFGEDPENSVLFKVLYSWFHIHKHVNRQIDEYIHIYTYI